jgi:hypothetical protein
MLAAVAVFLVLGGYLERSPSVERAPASTATVPASASASASKTEEPTPAPPETSTVTPMPPPTASTEVKMLPVPPPRRPASPKVHRATTTHARPAYSLEHAFESRD